MTLVPCMECGNALSTKAASCPKCGAPAALSNALSKRQTEILAQLRVDAEDQLPMLCETFRVVVRLNPVNQQIYQFNAAIESIHKNMERDQVCGTIDEAIRGIDLEQAVSTLGNSNEAIRECAEQFFSELKSDLAHTVPNYRAHMPDLPDTAAMGTHFGGHIITALHAYESDLESIAQHYRQLVEWLPRFDSIMNRSDAADFALGFAAGFFGGTLGQIAAETWDDWRGQNDQAFTQSFGTALDLFSNTAVAFTQHTEESIEPVLQQMMSDYVSLHATLLRGLAHFAVAGGNLEPYYRKSRTPETPPDDDTKACFEIVLGNLRGQGFSGRAECNVRAIWGL